MQATWLHTETRFFDVVSMSGVSKCTFCRPGFSRVFGVTHCSTENLRMNRVVASSEGATAPVSLSDPRSALIDVFADDTTQTAGCNRFRGLRPALQQFVLGCAAWLAHSSEVMNM